MSENNVALFSYMRAFGDGPRNFEPWSSDVDDTCELTPPSTNYRTTPTRGRFSSRQIERASLPYTVGLEWYWARTRDKARCDPIP
ncbi:hypothetical protein TNCV_3544401 [Trichonephila clavipes]|nr:hypothetical protein TNCV_3544401 [Trichonephila clavipes]